MKQSTYLKKVGPYCLIREIGQGSFARVYRGRIDGKNEEVAVKMMNKQNVRSESLSLIEKEIEILYKLDHPNIIKLLDYKRTQNHYYLVFEYCEHGDLDNYIRKNADNGKLPEAEVRKVVLQLAHALERMHSLRIVHRDLKLANILVSKNFQIKLADFGFAKYVEEDNYLTSYCGTPLTMAPEILKREKYNDRCDIWSVGVIMYQMLFGKAPFMPPKGGNINDLVKIIETQELQFPESPEISPQLKGLLHAMLQRDFRRRMSCIQFFNHPWLKDSKNVDDEYLRSICPAKQESTQEQSMMGTYHKVSEDINDEEVQAEKDDGMSEHQKDASLKFIAFHLLRLSYEYLDRMFGDISRINELADRIVNQKMNYVFLQSRVVSLALAVRLWGALKLEELNEFMKEQNVVLHTQSSNIGLISLQIKQPFQKYETQLNKYISQFKQTMIDSPNVMEQFLTCGYSIADNIYDETMELLINLIEHHKMQLVDSEIVDEMMRMLQEFVKHPPSLQQVELHINLQTGNDMNYYWHLFKLVRVNQEQISEIIEKQVQLDASELDRRISFQSHCYNEEQENLISFSQEDITQLQKVLHDERKQQSLLIIK